MNVSTGSKLSATWTCSTARPGLADAPVILLLHGFPTAGHMFRDLIPELAGHYRLIAPDLPGFGSTKAPPRGAFDYTLLARSGGEGSHDGDILNEFRGQMVASLQVDGRVVGKPHSAVRVFPDEDLQRQIDRDAGRSDHQRSAGFGVAKDQELGRVHAHPDLRSFATVVHQRKDRRSRCSNQLIQPFQCFVH
jgi:alpha/beta hydrolase family protein